MNGTVTRRALLASAYIDGFKPRERITIPGDYRDRFKEGEVVSTTPAFDPLTRDFKVVAVGSHHTVLEAIDGG